MMPQYNAVVTFPDATGKPKTQKMSFEAEDMIDAGLAVLDNFTLDLDETVISVTIEKV